MRLFVGVSLPDPLKERVQELLRDLEETVCRPQADVKWTPPAQIHFTVKFIGDVADEQRPVIETALDQAAHRVAPFSITVGGLGHFPTRGMARILWLGVRSGGENFQNLARSLQTFMDPLGYPAEDRPYIPHATLARLRSIRNMAILQAPLEKYKDLEFGTMQVSSFELVQSRLSSAGPEHTVLEKFSLTGADPKGESNA
jgi:2'-5' RNA ligase